MRPVILNPLFTPLTTLSGVGARLGALYHKLLAPVERDALVLDLLASRDEPLSVIVDALPRYAILKTKLDLVSIGGLAAVAPALAKMKAAFASERVSDVDGVRIDFNDGWVHLRASNTEPIARIIAEAPSRERAEQLVAACASAAGLSA